MKEGGSGTGSTNEKHPYHSLAKKLIYAGLWLCP
jgi:hypothetical protein